MNDSAKVRLLIVDDEVAQMQALCDTLEHQGYQQCGVGRQRRAQQLECRDQNSTDESTKCKALCWRDWMGAGTAKPSMTTVCYGPKPARGRCGRSRASRREQRPFQLGQARSVETKDLRESIERAFASDTSEVKAAHAVE